MDRDRGDSNWEAVLFQYGVKLLASDGLLGIITEEADTEGDKLHHELKARRVVEQEAASALTLADQTESRRRTFEKLKAEFEHV